MPATVTNITVAGPITVYTAAASTALPATTVGYSTAWGGTWADLGYTKGGAEFEHSIEWYDVEVDQENAPVTAVPIKESTKAVVRMSEGTLTNLNKSLGIGTLTSGSTEDVFTGGSSTYGTFKAIGINGLAPGTDGATQRYRRAMLHKARPEGATVVFKKDEETILEVNFNALIDTTKTAGARLFEYRDRVV